MSFVLKINDRFRNRKVTFFNDFTISLSHNAIADSFSFSYFFEPFNEEHKEFSCVTHFHEVTLEFQGELIFTGQLITQGYDKSIIKKPSSIAGYSLPGVFENCQIPPDLYPLQSNGLSLAQIARRISTRFNIDVVVDPAVSTQANKAFPASTASSTQTIKDYLTQLATQRNIILKSTAKGELFLTRSETSKEPVLTFDFRDPQLTGTGFSLVFNGEQLHSHITMMRQASMEGGNAGQETIRNPYVIGTVYRPKVVTQSSGDDNDTSLALRRELSNELRAVALTITTDRWVVDGRILRDGDIIEVFEPELYVYRMTRWFIESIEFRGNHESTTATINCVLPEVYNTDNIVSIYRNINLHALETNAS